MSGTPLPTYYDRLRPPRLLVSVLLFWMIFRSLMVLVPWKTWVRELHIGRVPNDGLPAPTSNDEPEQYRERFMQAADAGWEFARPWPGPRTRKQLDSWTKGGQFVVGWLSSRLEFLETLVGFPQEWDMFTPDVSTKRTLPRARLYFADGSVQVLRNPGEPADLRHFGHWFRYPRLRLAAVADSSSRVGCLGYCNLLRHRHAHNEKGSPLQRITLHDVTYHFIPPGVDSDKFVKEQMRRTREGGQQVSADYFSYDVTTGTGRWMR